MRPGPVIGLFVQFAMLGLLSAAVGLGHAGWAAGIAYAVGSWVLPTRAMQTAGLVVFGPADVVTLTRAALVGCVMALTAASYTGAVPVPVLVGITVVALVLDAVDGRVARRTGTASAFGARFDMEVDAFLILVLSCYVAPAAGPWVLAIGAMRYGYVVATWALPWLRGQLFPRYWRKVVAAVQGIVLVTAAADVLPRPVVVAALAGALALLTESFGRDVVHLWRHRAATATAVRLARAQAPVLAGAPDTLPFAANGPGAAQAPRTVRR